LRTIKLHLEFQLFPTAERTSDEAPAFDVVTMDGVHLGAAWERESRGGVAYLSMTLDDPSFEAPLNIAAFEREGGNWDLVWNRPAAKPDAGRMAAANRAHDRRTGSTGSTGYDGPPAGHPADSDDVPY
ncbi:DUF736 domain-containing protein, partial [Arenibaculum sp.]|uniref:DUF736 domain-containing protein n=1 Tax=Arenibaculum sp. TaxID=2865862 RepID=UPI002E1200D5|nr:DUF736 domain-containing protein [Arenibaculum sp.]